MKPNVDINKKTSGNIDDRLIKEPASQLPLQRINFILMGIAAVMIVSGFLLMTGAPSTAEAFNPDIFSTRRIVVGPCLAFIGFVAMASAIIIPFRKS